MNNDLQNLYYKYKNNKKIWNIVIQCILVYYKLRPGAAIESIKNSKIIETEIIPVLNKLNIKYIYEEDPQNIKHLYISNKIIPKSFKKSNKSFGNFLGYQCASNNFADPSIMKKGRIIFKLYESTTNTFILADVCPAQNNKILLYYLNLIDKSVNILDKFGLKLKLKLYDDKKRKYIVIKKNN